MLRFGQPAAGKPLGAGAVIIGLAFDSWAALASLLYFPLALGAIRTVNRGARGPKLIPVLGMAGRAMLVWAVINAVALALV